MALAVLKVSLRKRSTECAMHYILRRRRTECAMHYAMHYTLALLQVSLRRRRTSQKSTSESEKEKDFSEVLAVQLACPSPSQTLTLF